MSSDRRSPPSGTRDPRVASRTARLLRARRDRILELWRARVLADPEVPLANGLPAPVLADHVPALVDEIAAALERGEARPDGEAAGRSLARGPAGRRHAIDRLRVGYEVGEIVRELSHLRAAFLAAVEESGARPSRAGTRLVHAAIDEAMMIGARNARVAARAVPPGESGELAAAAAPIDESLRSIFERAPLGIAQSDPVRHRLLASNPALARILGRPSEELRGRAWAELRHPEDRARAEAWLTAIVEGGSCPALESRLVRADGTVAWAQETAVALREPDGAIASVLTFVEDVTARKTLEQERERFLQVRETWVAVAGHDLRGPLGAIAVGAQTLLESPELAPAHREIVERDLRSVRAMERMIRDFLELARDELPIAPREVDLRDVVRDAVAGASSGSASRPVVLEEDGELRGAWDPDRIAQAVTNLVANALTHGAPGAAVRVRAAGGPDEATIEVWNAGPPIAADEIPGLFEPFRRGRSAAGAGLGLGLHVVREVARAHGGEVEVASGPTGTTFRLRLPRRPA